MPTEPLSPDALAAIRRIAEAERDHPSDDTTVDFTNAVTPEVVLALLDRLAALEALNGLLEELAEITEDRGQTDDTDWYRGYYEATRRVRDAVIRVEASND